MKALCLGRRLTAGTYRVVRIFVRLLSVLALLLIAAFLFLRLYGVPEPLLREAVRRINAAGIPVEVDGINLTLRGWRAENLRYYSKHPDDLSPMFESSEVFFSLRNNPTNTLPNAWKMEVKAVGIRLHPSVEWGVEIPQNSPSCLIDRLGVSLDFLPDRIRLSRGEMVWLGSQFNVNGTVLKREKKGRGKPAQPLDQQDVPEPDAAPPVWVSEQQFQTLENRLKMLTLPGGARVDVDFVIDAADYAASRIEIDAAAEGVGFRGIGFSKAEIVGSFAYPTLQLRRMGFFQDKQSVQLSGEYDFDTGQAKGALYNSITSSRLLQLLPEKAQELLVKAGLRIDYLPRVEIDFGPAATKDLLGQLSGVFSFRSAAYKGIEIEMLRGELKRENNRIEFTQLQGSVLGQQARAGETGSAMHGGSAEGEVFWDGNTREFGVTVDADFDPHLLVPALAQVGTATNVIQRFRFRDRPPIGRVKLGANVDDWSSFYIDIQAMANDVVFQGVELSSINVTTAYKRGKLHLDPVAAMQGIDFTKGSAVLDFDNSTVTFDALSSMAPAALEDLICPGLNLFDNKIKVDGKVKINAQGVFDWETMRQTDFTAMIDAERLEIPVMATEHLRAVVVGTGPVIAVKDAQFDLYGGQGEGEFSMQWNPDQPSFPYEAKLDFTNVDFKSFIEFLVEGRQISGSGKMTGNARVEADLSTNFFATANGEVYVRVKDGQLTDLPLFDGFSRLMRKVVPSFTLFSITRLTGNFSLENGVVSSEDAYFEGEVLSVKGRGRYSTVSGFDAYIQAQVLSDSAISKVVRVITDPLMKFLEIRLEGTLASPTWRLEKFPEEISGLFRWKKE